MKFKILFDYCKCIDKRKIRYINDQVLVLCEKEKNIGASQTKWSVIIYLKFPRWSNRNLVYFLNEITKRKNTHTRNNGFQDTRHQKMKDSDPQEIGNKWGKPYAALAYCHERVFKPWCGKGKLRWNSMYPLS